LQCNPLNITVMAKIYSIVCPKCGHRFEVMKGILVSESGLDPIPEERLEETPFKCPVCGLEMSVEDEDFKKHVVAVMMAD